MPHNPIAIIRFFEHMNSVLVSFSRYIKPFRCYVIFKRTITRALSSDQNDIFHKASTQDNHFSARNEKQNMYDKEFLLRVQNYHQPAQAIFDRDE